MTRELYIPGLRISSKTNSRKGWRADAKESREQRAQVSWAWVEHWESWRPTIPATVTLTRIAPRSLDRTNLDEAFKAVIDQIAFTVGVDDREDERVRYVCRQEKGQPREYGVRIQIGPMERCNKCGQVVAPSPQPKEGETE